MPPDAPRERPVILEMLAIAAPVVATTTSYTAMQFIDGLMVSRIGPDPVYLSASGNGGVVAFVPISVMMGLLTVINTYVSQNLGAGRSERGAGYAWTGLWLAFFAWLILAPASLAVPWVFAHSGHDERLVGLESAFARTLLLGSILTMCTRGIAQFFYGMHRPRTVMTAAIIGNLCNFIGNSFLIYGPTPPARTGAAPLDAWFAFTSSVCARAGFAGLGVQGSALSTVIATGIELSIPLSVFLGRTYNRLYRTRSAWRFSRSRARDILRIGWPGAFMFGNEMVCWAYLMAFLIGRFGEADNSAGWIALRYIQIAFMPAIGMSIAVTAMVGKCMGMGRPDLAARRAWTGLAVTMTYMGLCGVAMVVFRKPAIALFLPDEHAAASDVVAIGSRVMIAAAVFQLFDAMGITMTGALRGAGDTVWPGVATMVLSWGCLFGLGNVLVRVAPAWRSIGPWTAAAAYIILLGLAVLLRFIGGKWKRIRLVNERPSPA